ncbi:hypothetical protein [Actinospongicola halichondriae]|uniref:hypothetical protein n=1 Tax=Actinospongicola halichondriae TaxID=3236844 RepID=UPI003D38003B
MIRKLLGLLAGLVALIVVGGAMPAKACTLALSQVAVAESSVGAGGQVSVTLSVYEIVPADETTTTTTSATSTSEPSIAQCPETRPVGEVVLRFVQGDAATELVTLTEPPLGFETRVAIPGSAASGPGQIVAVSGGEVLATSAPFEVVRPASPPAPPVNGRPDFTG